MSRRPLAPLPPPGPACSQKRLGKSWEQHLSRRGCSKRGNPQRNGSPASQTPTRGQSSKKTRGTGGPAPIIPSMCAQGTRRGAGCTSTGDVCTPGGKAAPACSPLPAQPCAAQPCPSRCLWDVDRAQPSAQLPPTLECRCFPPPRGRGLGTEHRGGKSRLGTRLKRLGGGSHRTATSRSARVWQGQASCGFGMCRGNQAQGSVRMEVVKAVGIPSRSSDGGQETELLLVTPGHPPARRRDEVPGHP